MDEREPLGFPTPFSGSRWSIAGIGVFVLIACLLLSGLTVYGLLGAWYLEGGGSASECVRASGWATVGLLAVALPPLIGCVSLIVAFVRRSLQPLAAGVGLAIGVTLAWFVILGLSEG